MKLDILAFGAHPDDVELGAAATIAKEVSLGKKVGIIDLTQGELGTRGSKELRIIEATKAANILGVAIRENLKFADGFFINDKMHQLEVIKNIWRILPESKNISVWDPDDRLLIDTNYDGAYETGVTSFTGSEIHFKMNPNPNGETPYEFFKNRRFYQF